MQPAVLQRLGRRVGPAEVLAHDDRPANQDLAVGLAGGRVVTAASPLRRRDADLDAGKRLADRRREAIAGPHDRRAAGRLGQAVGVEDREAQAVEIAADRRIELAIRR